MTYELRGYLKQAIDTAVRKRIDWSAVPRCPDCGVESTEYLDDCKRCFNRRRSKLRRGTLVAA